MIGGGMIGGKMRQPADMAALQALSARIGADAALIQSAGGNTSVKDGAVMWIKASGTQLAEALAREIFVPVDPGAIRAALAAGEARADRPAEFALAGDLRPSIETSLHAVFPQRVVVHVHCVNTIALAIRADARAVLADRLAGFDWGFVPYARPGADLARLVVAARRATTDVVVLGNHGLIVAAETVAAVAALLARVVAAVRVAPAPLPAPDLAALAARAGAGFAPLPAGHPLHGVALSPARLAVAEGGSLYPDHVIFCGPGVVSLDAGETPAQAVARRQAQGLPAPVFLLVPGAGALIRDGASAGALALARCLGDVLARLPEGAAVVHLTGADNAALLDWDAEKYRQTLNAR